MGRSCYVIKNKEGGVDNVLAPNDQPSGLYQRAMEVLGDQKQALSVWGTAYSPTSCLSLAIGCPCHQNTA